MPLQRAISSLEFLGRALREPGNDAEPSRIGHRRGQFCEADEVHAPLDDGVLMPNSCVIRVFKIPLQYCSRCHAI
jgi:hypothetical protein